MSTTTFYASTDHLEAFLAEHTRPAPRHHEVKAPAPDPAAGGVTGYQPSLAPKRLLAPLRPKGFRPSRRGVALIVAALMLVGDAIYWWMLRRG